MKGGVGEGVQWGHAGGMIISVAGTLAAAFRIDEWKASMVTGRSAGRLSLSRLEVTVDWVIQSLIKQLAPTLFRPFAR